MQVIVAHADPAARERLVAVIGGAGFPVRGVQTAEAMLAACRASPTEVVVLQHDLAGPGPEPVARLKRDPVAFATAIIVLAPAGVSGAELDAALEAGAFDVLREASLPEEVVARVRAASSVKNLRDELLQQARRLEVSLFEDPLTGLYNRRFVMAQVGALISGARRHGRPLSVAMIDVDRFKAFNDEYGHTLGDRVLQVVAGALHDRMRAEDYLGRLGGEEFLALLPDTDGDAAGAIAERLRSTVESVRVPAETRLLRVTVSIGWATWEDGEDVDSLVRRADEALYVAKDAGRDVVRPAATLRRRT